jgi:uncharacterized protein (DUF433 family)
LPLQRGFVLVNQIEFDLETSTMDWRDRITSDPQVLVGKPIVKGTRISVELILGWLANGWTFEMILESYPHLSRDDVLAALAFAAEMMREEHYVAAHIAAA